MHNILKGESRWFSFFVFALTLLTTTGLQTLCYSGTVQQQPMRLWYDKPAQYFEESLPIGNGKLGALVYGGTDTCLIELNDITLWTGKPVDHHEGTGAAKWIPEIRKALFAENYRLADSLQLHVEGHNSEFYQPLGALQLIDLNEGQVTGYHRELDLDSALIRDHFVRRGTAITREYLASNPDRLIAFRLTGNVNCKLVMTSLVPHQVKGSGSQLTMTGHATGNPLESIHFCTILRVKTDGSVTTADSTLTISNAKEAVAFAVMANETLFAGFNNVPTVTGASHPVVMGKISL